MPPIIGPADLREGQYIATFKCAAVAHGQPIHYEKDVSAFDLGLDLYGGEKPLGREVTGNRVWFQFKGLSKERLPAEKYRAGRTVRYNGIKTEHLRHWDQSREPVFVVLYIESVDIFLVEHVRTLIYRNLGPNAFHRSSKVATQKTVTLDFLKSSELRPEFWEILRAHYLSLSVFDTRDPLRAWLEPLPPDDFGDLTASLLKQHDFRFKNNLDPQSFLEGDCASVQFALGTFHRSYEVRSGLFTTYGYGGPDSVRKDAPPWTVQGPARVFVDSSGTATVNEHLFAEYAKRHPEQPKPLLAILNRERDGCLTGAFRRIAHRLGTQPLVQFSPQTSASPAHRPSVEPIIGSQTQPSVAAVRTEGLGLSSGILNSYLA